MTRFAQEVSRDMCSLASDQPFVQELLQHPAAASQYNICARMQVRNDLNMNIGILDYTCVKACKSCIGICVRGASSIG